MPNGTVNGRNPRDSFLKRQAAVVLFAKRKGVNAGADVDAPPGPAVTALIPSQNFEDLFEYCSGDFGWFLLRKLSKGVPVTWVRIDPKVKHKVEDRYKHKSGPGLHQKESSLPNSPVSLHAC